MMPEPQVDESVQDHSMTNCWPPSRRAGGRQSSREILMRILTLAILTIATVSAAPSEAAHVRTGTDSGIGMKPSERYTVPLCATCHEKQHRIGELSFWSALRIDPLNVALRLWTVSADVKAGERTVFRARQHINLAKA